MHALILEARADPGLLLFLVLVALLAVAIPLAIAGSAKVHRIWTEVAGKLGLAKEKGLVLRGQVEGHDVTARGVGGKNSATFVAFADVLPRDVEFWREGMWSLMDPEIGDPTSIDRCASAATVLMCSLPAMLNCAPRLRWPSRNAGRCAKGSSRGGSTGS